MLEGQFSEAFGSFLMIEALQKLWHKILDMRVVVEYGAPVFSLPRFAQDLFPRFGLKLYCQQAAQFVMGSAILVDPDRLVFAAGHTP